MTSFVLNVIGKGAAAADFAALAIGRTSTLAKDFAFDLPVESRAALEAARQMAGDEPWDINLVSTEHRRKKLLVADMDSTIISVECLDELADMAGLKPQIAAITRRAMRGENRIRGGAERSVSPCSRACRLSASATHLPMTSGCWLNPGARTLVATMRIHGAHTMRLVNGGFAILHRRVPAGAGERALGFDAERGNRLLDDGARLTGEVAAPILGRQAKLEALESSAGALGLALSQTLAVYGDGASNWR